MEDIQMDRHFRNYCSALVGHIKMVQTKSAI